ncbi:MAG: 3-phosphoserine/phosphohydroxythreonine transaminase [Chitinophagales bacterium]|nr:3-phosphoserine/phosphohydroxythreonine transaminase [Chitinophagales bacterium]MCZ2394493.1 3-phosphoserine/phosphohydroxythreonine transaminase [Chitinophagales bacterium]
MKIHNFGAGPCILPQEVFQKAAAAVLDLNQSGLSILEISHRSVAFDEIIDNAQNLAKELLDIPKGYKVLFLQGGASLQFSMVPMNFLPQDGKAAYLDTGVWSSKAIKEASLFGEVLTVASSKDKNYSYIPKDFNLPQEASYFHITTNNTIYGSEIFEDYDVAIPLIADMSSDIFSRKIDVSKYDLIYAGAQKNVGPAGVTIVIVKEAFLEKKARLVPTMLDYQVHAKNDSLFNTPPVFPIYVSMLNLEWLKSQGGVEKIEYQNLQKAELLYQEIERNSLFKGNVETASRSRMNVTFSAIDEDIEKRFLSVCKEKGIHGIKGHRLSGGFRASLYNALPLSSVEYLVETMKDFESSKS